MPSSNYTRYEVNAVSKGIFNKSTGIWNLDSLSANSNAMIVFTVTAKKAGYISTNPSVNYLDNSGSNVLNASNSNLNINKDIRASIAYSVSNTKVKQGSYFNLAITLKNIGLDTSGVCTVKTKLSTAFSKISTTTQSPFRYVSNGTWTGKV